MPRLTYVELLDVVDWLSGIGWDKVRPGAADAADAVVEWVGSDRQPGRAMLDILRQAHASGDPRSVGI